MELVVSAPNGAQAAKIEVSDVAFAKNFNEALVHQVVTAYLAGGRAGTKAQKTRAEVRGGGTKPWRQKGTGRARAGTINSPIWRTGGKAFAAKPQDHEQKVNKKMYRGALKSILSELVRTERLTVVRHSDLELTTPKTRDLVSKLSSFGISEALVLVQNWDENLFLSARNLPKVEVRDVANLNPVVLLKYKQVVVTEDALKKIEEVLA